MASEAAGSAGANALEETLLTTLRSCADPAKKPAPDTGHRAQDLARAAAHALESVSPVRGIDGAALLSRQGAKTPRQPGRSPRGHARFLPASDGWWVLNLARDDDVELVPALVEAEVSPGFQGAWEAVAIWGAARSAAANVERAGLLGIPASRPGETPRPVAPWACASAFREEVSPGRTAPRVVNLGALWAAPLAAHLLGQAGFEVVHVESASRPDLSRVGDPELYRTLRAGADIVTLDFASTAGQRQLLDMLHQADVVIEASRPRALEALDASHAKVDRDGRARTWLQITAYGLEQPHRVGFGDDAAVAGGLLAWDRAGLPDFVHDAVADPLTGLLGAFAVAGLHAPDRSTHVAMSLSQVAAFAAGGVHTP